MCPQEINQFRMHLATLFVYDWITVPLVYTQVSHFYHLNLSGLLI